jgi:hypothetical protein
VLDELRKLYDIESKLKAMPWEERACARRVD